MTTEEKQELKDGGYDSKSNSNDGYLIESSHKVVKCGVAWDLLGDQAVDLDITVVALNSYSLEIDAAYYNKTSILNDAICHSGDNKTGLADGDDEQITIKLAELSHDCHSLWFIVNAYSGGTFKDVETAKFTLYDETGQQIHSYPIVFAGYNNNNALVMGVLFRDVNEMDWRYKKCEISGKGSNFVESRPLMEDGLAAVYSKEILDDRPRDRTKTYELKKSDQYVISPDIEQVVVGLGWDPASGSDSIDVDGSVIVYNKQNGDDTRLEKKDVVYFSNKADFTGECILHHGDNLTGAGDGDDELIDINLRRIDSLKAEIEVICVIINIFKGASSFNSIRNCFARLMDENGKELCRYTLSGQYATTGMVMCRIDKKANGCWSMKALGVGCTGRTAKDSVEVCRRILTGEEAGAAAGEDGGCTCVIL